MSETKAEYYAKHLEQHPNQIVVDEQVETVHPIGLPTLLAQQVIEYEKTLLPSGRTPATDRLVEQFNTVLLAAAKPLLTGYLGNLTNPPVVVKYDPANDPGYQRAVEELNEWERDRQRIRSGKL